MDYEMVVGNEKQETEFEYVRLWQEWWKVQILVGSNSHIPLG